MKADSRSGGRGQVRSATSDYLTGHAYTQSWVVLT